jgi:DNA polymerase II
MRVTGWLLDLFPQEESDGIVLWVIGEDGKRYRFEHSFPVTFYAAGSSLELRALWKFLQAQPEPLELYAVERRDIFEGIITVLACEVKHPLGLLRLFARVAKTFPNLTFYDADIHIALRYAAAFNVFPLTRCEIESDEENHVMSIHALESRWELDPAPPPLRILSLEPDTDPSQAIPRNLVMSYDRVHRVLPLEPTKNLIVNLFSTLQCYDPDLIMTSWGDTWLLPRLLEDSKKVNWYLPFNRESTRDVILHKELTYFSYGQIVYRGQQISLLGRLHIDQHNTMLWSDYDVEGVFEMARVTGLPAQDAARLSPGTGISSMQFITALQEGILVPSHKHRPEKPKTALELMRSDMGGIAYQPIIGLHKDVAGIDFTSMYPSLIIKFNISPEIPRASDGVTPGTNEPGIIPKTLISLLEKRVTLKTRLSSIHKKDIRRKPYEARACAEKWLLLTSSGYLGYKNARFGGVETHEILTECGRETLLTAKEITEELGFEVLHMYVDGLWMKRDNFNKHEHVQDLLELIEKETGVSICLDGVYKWIVFLPSKRDSRVPVPNSYFGVFQDGTIKARGIEARRRDTPPFIAQMQREMLEILARAPTAEELYEYTPLASAVVEKILKVLQTRQIPLEDLLITKKLSRDLDNYRTPSRAARAARQLVQAGKHVGAGQRVKYWLTRGGSGVCAWGLEGTFDKRRIDTKKYMKLTIGAGKTILDSLVSVDDLQVRVDELIGPGAMRLF